VELRPLSGNIYFNPIDWGGHPDISHHPLVISDGLVLDHGSFHPPPLSKHALHRHRMPHHVVDPQRLRPQRQVGLVADHLPVFAPKAQLVQVITEGDRLSIPERVFFGWYKLIGKDLIGNVVHQGDTSEILTLIVFTLEGCHSVVAHPCTYETPLILRASDRNPIEIPCFHDGDDIYRMRQIAPLKPGPSARWEISTALAKVDEEDPQVPSYPSLTIIVGSF